MDNPIRTSEELRSALERSLSEIKVLDLRTGIFPPEFAGLYKSGLDFLLTSPSLVEEFHLCERTMKREQFGSLSLPMQADLVWTKLFIEHSPLSDAQLGVLQVLRQLGVDLSSKNLDRIRTQYKSLDPRSFVDRIFQLAGVESVIMQNDIFNPLERQFWLKDSNRDPRFKPSFSLDVILKDPKRAAAVMKEDGFPVSDDGIGVKGNDLKMIAQFCKKWIQHIEPAYASIILDVATLLSQKSRSRVLLDEALLPLLLEENLPLFLDLRMRESAEFSMELESLVNRWPEIVFFISVRSDDENLLPLQRAYSNVTFAGFSNLSALASQQDVRGDLRFEMLGVAHIPQYSDASVMEHLVSRWRNIRQILMRSLYKRYVSLVGTGWKLFESDVRNDLRALLGLNLERILGKSHS